MITVECHAHSVSATVRTIDLAGAGDHVRIESCACSAWRRCGTRRWHGGARRFRIINRKATA